MKSLSEESRLHAIQETSEAKMSWFSELAGKAESLLNNIDERTANVLNSRNQQPDVLYAEAQAWLPRQAQTRRPLSRQCSRKSSSLETRSSYSPARKPSTKQQSKIYPETTKDGKQSLQKKALRKTLESPARADRDHEVIREQGYRRRSLPNGKDIEDVITRTNKMESLGMENQMLKNEINVCNQEIADLLDKLHTLEFDLREVQAKNDNLEKLYQTTKQEKESLAAELSKIKEKSPPEPEYGPEYSELSNAYRALEKEFANLNDRNRELQSQLKEIEIHRVSNSSIQMKLENDLRFAHMTLNDLRSDLEKSRNECHRIQSDWDAYKLRVKNMLLSKDKEIQALQKNPEHSEGTKMLAEQVDNLRQEREQLCTSMTRAHDECAEATRRVEQVEMRAHGAERLVGALREALREERLARNKAENQCIINNKALKNLQMETSQQIANLQATIRDKDFQIQKYRTSPNRSITSVCPVSDTSALNVAECNRAYDTISNEKIQLLTQSLIAKQGRIDVLLAENNNLKLNIETLDEAHKREVNRLKSDQKILNVNDGDALLRTKLGTGDYTANSAISKLSVRVGVMMRRYPIFRMFIIVYMGVLHMWVLIVLLTYSPEVH